MFRSLAVASAVIAFFLAILGSWVRISGAGMSCPDWPLCNGSLIPHLQGGVIFEWSHRLLALIEGFLLIGTLLSGLRVRTAISGVSPALGILVGVFLLQVALGGITVQLANRPDSVVSHWATAMALLATLTTLATLAILRPRTPLRLTPLTGPLSLTVLAAFATMCAGVYVSSSGAGLACLGIFGCGASLLGLDPFQHAQMLHRLFAATLLVIAGFTTYCVFAQRPRRDRVAAAAGIGLALLLLQIVLGLANVAAFMPLALREAHAMCAVATFLAYVVAALFDALGE
jgi:heme A synthase